MKFSQLLNRKDRAEEKKLTEIVRNSEFFDERWYVSQYQDVFKKLKDPARHYYKTGWKENRNPSANFSTAEYLRLHQECGICPLLFEHNRNGYVDLSVCAIVKNEAPYIKEWIEYHRLAGVKRFYIYDNESTDNLHRVLEPYIRKGLVIYQYYPGKSRQIPCYNKFIKEYGNKSKWVAFINVDEFIIPVQNTDIPEFLRDYEDYPGVCINLVDYDSCGFLKKPKGGVLENYTRVHYDENMVPFHLTESIVRPDRVEKIINPHYCLFKNDELAVNENKELIGGSLKERAYISPYSVNKIRINHYFCKSKAEAEAASLYDNVDGSRQKEISEDYLNFSDYKYDYVAYRYVVQLNPKNAQNESIKMDWLYWKNLWIGFKHFIKPNALYDYIDEKWYFNHYPDAKKTGLSAASHYMNIGWRKGYNPSEKFDTAFYLKKYADVAKSGIPPLLHYINRGKEEGRYAFIEDEPQVNATILSEDALQKRAELIYGKTEDLYIEAEALKSYFDEKWYVTKYPEVKKSKLSAGKHYITTGWRKGYNPSAEFDTNEYLKKNPECRICPLIFEFNRNGYVDLSTCTIMKNEAPYVKEWIDYHRLVGVKRFYIYDNESEDNLKDVLEPYIASGIVVYKYYPGEARQRPAYNECIKEYKDKTQWLAFIDADEYIVPKEKDTIPEFLKDYEEYSGVGINWISFDSNGHQKKPEGGVIENYTRVHYDNNWWKNHHFKSIVKPRDVKILQIHYAVYQKGKYAVDENKNPINERNYTSDISVNKIQINHYYCKSEQEAIAKVNRGRAVKARNVLKKIKKYEIDYDEGKYDCCAYRYLMKLDPENAGKIKAKHALYAFLNMAIKFYHLFKKDELSKYIDEDWYFAKYPAAQKSGLSAKEHYLKIGWTQGYNPSKRFNTKYYMKKYPDVTKIEICPLLHYLSNGRYEKRRSAPDTKFSKFYNKITAKTSNIISKAVSVALYPVNGLIRTFKNNASSDTKKNEFSSEYFDEKWYLENYPEVKGNKLSAIEHYNQIGWKEGKNPSESFNTAKYLKEYPECQISPLVFEQNRNGYVDLSICAIMKNEAPYIKEWIDYHRLVGVKRFYIYDNESEDGLKDVLKPYIEQGIVVYKYYPGEAKQMPAYNECLKTYKDKTKWLAIIDADEFIVPLKKDNIPEFLKDYEAYPGVGINWVCYDSNGHAKKPKGGILENFTRVHYDEQFSTNHHIKSIVRPQMVEKCTNPHYSWYVDDKCAVTENFGEIDDNMNHGDFPRAITDIVSVDKIRINHYYSKSEEEYKAKIERGRAPLKGVKRKFQRSSFEFDDYKYDYAVYKYITKLKPEISQRETVRNLWLKVKNIFIGLKHWLNDSPVSEYIDEDWYFAKYPEAKNSGLSAFKHYMNIGWHKGYNPSEKFDTEFYLRKYKDVARAGINPLLHFVNKGMKEGRVPCNKARNSSLSLNKGTCLCTRIREWFANGEKYNEIWERKEYFDGKWYASKYPEAADYNGGTRAHYRKEGWKKGYNPSAKFNTGKYLKQYPECKICPLDFEYNRNGYVDLAICAIMKNEAPYVKEWIDYHRLVGVKRFYIYDNESEDNLKEVLEPYTEQGVVVYKFYPGEARQIPAYEECIKEYKLKNEWIAFIDADEFIMPVNKDNIPEFLADYKNAPAVVVDWIYYDSSNHKTKPTGGLLENYVRVQYDPQIQSTHRIKSIVHPVDVAKVVNPHYCTYKNGRNAVDECHREVNNSYTDTVSVQKIRINHYYCKSMEEYRNKIERGRATQKKSVKRKFSVRDCLYDDYKYDYTAFRYVIKLKPDIAVQELFHYVFVWVKNIFVRATHPFSKHSVYRYFDEKWYIANYPDVKESGLSAIDHYNTIGWKKGYNPNRNFDTVSYLEKYPNATKEGATPLYHFLRYGRYKDEDNSGKKENARISKLCKLVTDSEYFDENWYVKQYPEVSDSGLDPVEHYLTVGWEKGYNPSKKFVGDAYLENYSDIKAAGKNPLLHYLQYGQKEKRQVFSVPTVWDNIFNPYKNKPLKYRIVAQSGYFNKKWYLKQYPDVKDSGLDPIEHYLTVGWKKGYNPSTKFDGNAYLDHYQDVKKANVNPLLHYLQYGQNGKRQVFSQPTVWDNIFNPSKNKTLGYQVVASSGYFDKKWYLKQYPDVKDSGLDPIEHYLTVGWKQGYNPSTKFDGNDYLEHYQDVVDADKNPLLHYLQYGKDENRICKEAAFSIVRFPANCKKYVYEGTKPSQKIGKIAVFASFSNDGKIDDYVVYYLKSLKKVCDAIIFVADNPVAPNEAEKIKQYVIYANFERHNEHCFGSYKRGYLYALNNNLLDNAEELIFCNDSFCGPVFPFKKMFDEMVGRKVDFWSLLADNRSEYYLDKSFLVFKNKVFNTNEFTEFWKHVEKPINVKQFANKYEIELTQKLINMGFTCDSYIRFTNDKKQYPYIFGDNPAYFPLWLLNQGCPLIKTKTLYKNGENLESVNRVISYVKHKNIELGGIIDKYKQNLAKVKFSVIMPTYNRKDIISDAIDSLLNQTYQKFELIIVDDGSVDDTYGFVKDKYGKELKKGKIKYYYKENEGVCKARNYGLSKASCEWVTYLDSDNMVYPVFLETFAVAIQENPDFKTFYADLCRASNRKRASRDFDLNQMYFANFIDLGVFCNHKSVYDELGGFDENIKRLVDWELILRYTKKYTPYHISKSVMLYNDIDDHTRISNSLNYRDCFNYVRKKHSPYPVVTTMITTYNHQDYITEAIESAIKQNGYFIHEIIISDDGSTDDTPKIIAEYAEMYPHLIRNISSGKNVGISENMRKCFEAATGKYIAILEGDDYWTDAQKLEKQMQFLENNPDCAMVFSRVKVYNEDTKRYFLLDRHNNLPEKLTGKHFLKEMSLVVNFSCAMYRRECLMNLPEKLYESRLSEISLSMYLENKGKIGFMATPLSVYRQNSGGVWSGSDKKKQLMQGLIARQTALKVCADKYKPAIQKIIDEQYIKPLQEIEQQEQQEQQEKQTKQAV